MSQNLRILFLLTKGFGGGNGIAKLNRDFLTALDACETVERVFAIPRQIPEVIEGMLPEAVVYDRAAACGTAMFWRRLVTVALYQKANLIICESPTMLPAAWVIAHVHGARLALIIHEPELWTRASSRLLKVLARSVDSFAVARQHAIKTIGVWCNVSLDRAFVLAHGLEGDQVDTFDSFNGEEYRARVADWVWGA